MNKENKIIRGYNNLVRNQYIQKYKLTFIRLCLF